jgi:hypothetical protein
MECFFFVCFFCQNQWNKKKYNRHTETKTQVFVWWKINKERITSGEFTKKPPFFLKKKNSRFCEHDVFQKSKKREIAMKIFVVFLVCVAVMFTCWHLFAKRKPIETLPLAQKETIFVILPYYDSERVIDNIFALAKHPLRIFIGIGQRCRSQPNVRSLDAAQPFGNSVSRELVMAQLYAKEDFILCLHSSAHLICQDWDVILLETLQKKQVISYWPLKKVSSDGTTFPTFETFRGSYPLFQSHPTIRSETCKSFEIGLATYDFLFGKPETLLPLLRHGLPCISDRALQLLLSFELFNANVSIITPSRHMMIQCMPSTTNESSRSGTLKRAPNYLKLKQLSQRIVAYVLLGSNKAAWNEQTFPKYIQGRSSMRTAESFFFYLGVDVKRKQMTCHGKMGLFGQVSSYDIIARMGTMAAYEDIMFALCGQMQQQVVGS